MLKLLFEKNFDYTKVLGGPWIKQGLLCDKEVHTAYE